MITKLRSVTSIVQFRAQLKTYLFRLSLVALGIGRTWEKFSSLPAKKPRNFETQPEKKTFSQIEEGRTSSYQWELIVVVLTH